MGWCATCAGDTPRPTRRQFLSALGRASLAIPLVSKAEAASPIPDEAGDVRIGREVEPELLKAFGGYYDSPDLQNYVAQIGHRVAAAGDTRFNFQFRVVDHPAINAMALPGGFVYLTRGMLAELNEEAQLAGILGHEITHVNSRHAAKLITKTLGTQMLTLAGVVGAAASGSGAAASAIAMIGTHVSNYTRLGYGREFELEADEVGLRYTHQAGYDPLRMVVFLKQLRRTDILRGQALYHGFEATHPDTAERIKKADTMANILITRGGALEIKADAYKAQLDRLKYGEAKDQQRLRVYTVKAGDTLASIARNELGDERRRYELASTNGLRDDAQLSPGIRLKLIVKQ
jgi:predicted Zn-dependent protease